MIILAVRTRPIATGYSDAVAPGGVWRSLPSMNVAALVQNLGDVPLYVSFVPSCTLREDGRQLAIDPRLLEPRP